MKSEFDLAVKIHSPVKVPDSDTEVGLVPQVVPES